MLDKYYKVRIKKPFYFLVFIVVLFYFFLPFISRLIVHVYVYLVSNYDLDVPSRLQSHPHQLQFLINQLRADLQANIVNQSTKYDFKTIFDENMHSSKTLKFKSSLKNIFMPWSFDSNSALKDLLNTDYYDLVADDNICSKIRTKAPFSYQNYFNYTCETDKKVVFTSRKLDISKLLNDFDDNIEGEKYSITGSKVINNTKNMRLMSICSPCLVSDLGKISVHGYRPILMDCKPYVRDFPNSFPKNNYDEVFVISQFWGSFYFHKMVEDIPRMALFVLFLQSHPSIKIHTMDNSPRTQKIFKALGLDPARIVSGRMVAKIAYVPRPTKCGMSNFLEAQILNKIYTDYIRKHIRQPIRNKLVVIKRSGRRRLVEHDKIVAALNSTVSKYNLELHEFKDNPLPSFNETMLLFSEAVAVLAPHGAGLSNIFFSQPGTLVVEGNLRNEFNLCYQRLAYTLGMRYYVISALNGGSRIISLNVTVVKETMEELLQMLMVGG